MKKHIQLILFCLTATSSALASTEREEELYSQLNSGGSEARDALRVIIDESESISSVMLFMASGVALSEERFSDAAYLFYIAKFRAQFDYELFTPIGAGGDSPMTLVGVLSQQIGSSVNSQIMKRPKEFSQSVRMTNEWIPKVDESYHPGWEYSSTTDITAARLKLAELKKSFDEEMGGLAQLLSEPIYFEAFKTLQDFNMKSDETRPSKEEYDAAVETMKKIEKDRGIRGIFYDPSNAE